MLTTYRVTILLGKKPPVDLVPTVPAVGSIATHCPALGPAYRQNIYRDEPEPELPTVQAGWRNIQNPS